MINILINNSALQIDRVAFTIFGKEIYWYALILVAAILTVFFLCCYRGKKKGYKSDTFIDLCYVILIPGIIGARALYVIVNWESSFAGNLSEIYKIWNGGLAILGGFVLAIPCYIIYCVKKKLNLWELLDLIVPCLALAQCIGRWGNYVNQELYGPVVLDKAWQFFPYATFIDATGSWHMATFFYESAWSFMTFIVLSVIYYNKKHKTGDVFMLYIVLYSIIRIILDAIKIDGTLTNQLICVGMILIVIALYITRERMLKNEAFSNKLHSKINNKLLSDYVPPKSETAEVEK